MYWKYYKFHPCYALVKMLIFSTHSMKYIWYSPKKVNILYVFYVLSLPLCCMTNWAASWKNKKKKKKMACAPSEDADQPGHPPSLIRVFAVRSIGSQGPNASSCGQRRLWSGWSESSLGARHFVGFVMRRLISNMDSSRSHQGCD